MRGHRFVIFAFIITFLFSFVSIGDAFDTGNAPISDFVITGIDCEMKTGDACRYNDCMGLPESSDCWTNDNHKIVLGINVPDDMSCSVELEAYFNGTSENDESILMTVNDETTVFEDDGRDSGVSSITFGRKFTFIKGTNEITLTHPNFSSECNYDSGHSDGEFEGGELNFGNIRIYNCINLDSPVINSIEIYPEIPVESENVICNGSYSGSDIVQETIEWYKVHGNRHELIKSESMCVAVAGDYSSTLESSYLETGGIYECSVTVYDDDNLKDNKKIMFKVGEGVINSPPEVDIIYPTDGAFFYVGRTITCKGIAYDSEDGTIPEDKITWSYVLRGREKIFEEKSIRNAQGESLANLTLSSTGTYKIKLQAVDSNGASSSKAVTVSVYNPGSFIYIPIIQLDTLLGSRDFIKETIVNDLANEDTFTLTLSGYNRAEFMMEGLANIEYASPDKRSIRVRVDPFSSMNIFVKVFSDDYGVKTLTQESTSQGLGKTIEHNIDIRIGQNPNFPASDWTDIIMALVIAFAIFVFFSGRNSFFFSD